MNQLQQVEAARAASYGSYASNVSFIVNKLAKIEKAYSHVHITSQEKFALTMILLKAVRSLSCRSSHREVYLDCCVDALNYAKLHREAFGIISLHFVNELGLHPLLVKILSGEKVEVSQEDVDVLFNEGIVNE